MKKRIGSVLLALALCLSLLPATALAEGEGDTESSATTPSAEMPAYSGGSGTAEKPWLISTVDDLKTLAETVNSGKAVNFDAERDNTGNYHGYYFKQTANLDLSGIQNWDPIGYSLDEGRYFAGQYDGDGYTIANATSSGQRDSEGYATVGIFGWVLMGSVEELVVDNANFTATGINNSSWGGYSYAGGIAAGAFVATIKNCTVTNSAIDSKRLDKDGNANQNNCAGGVVGYSAGAQFVNCASISNQITSQCYGGGFVGENDDDYEIEEGTPIDPSTYTNCFVTNCSVNATTPDSNGWSFAGSFIGMLGDQDIDLTNCYAYKIYLSTEETSACIVDTGVFVGHFYKNGGYTASIKTENCYYGECDTTNNKGTATAKEIQDFANGTVAGLLGNAFTQGKDGYPVFPVPATGITLNHSTLSLAVGGSVALTATLTPENATDAVVWSSNNKEIAEVSNNGTVTAKALGTATITATVGSYTATCEVTVAVPVTGVTLDKETMNLTAGSTGTLTATITPENATNKNLTWTSDNEAVVAVSDGVVSAVAAGTANITVMTVDGGKTATCVVTVTRRSSSSSRPSYPITTPDKTENGSVTVTPKSAKRGSTVTITVTPDAGYMLDKLTVTDKDGKELSLTKKSDTEYTFVMPAGKVEITPSFVKQAEEPSRAFVDVKTGDYFYDAVQWAVGKGITNGTSAETFSPEAPCTRAQIVTFLWRAAGSPVVNYAMDLSDVAGDAYYAEAVRWALSEGITTGTSDHTFSPDAVCTREQAVTFLWRAAGSPAVSGESAFEDVGADAYYARAVAWAAQNGVTNGISQALFGTGSDCTRAQIVTFLYRAQQGK